MPESVAVEEAVGLDPTVLVKMQRFPSRKTPGLGQNALFPQVRKTRVGQGTQAKFVFSARACTGNVSF